jgi:hypothetical protein
MSGGEPVGELRGDDGRLVANCGPFVAENFEPGASVADVARCHGVNANF